MNLQVGDLVAYEGRLIKVMVTPNLNYYDDDDIEKGAYPIEGVFFEKEDYEWWFGMPYDEIVEEYGEDPYIDIYAYDLTFISSTSGKTFQDCM